MGSIIFSVILMLAGIAGYVVLTRVGASFASSKSTYDIANAARFRLAAKGALGVGSFLSLLVFILSTFVIISTGHVGVVAQFGKVEDVPLYEGFHFVAPYKNVYQLSTQVQKKQGKFDAGSKDLQAVHVVMGLNYRLTPSSAPRIFREVGYDFENTIIALAEQEVLKAHTAAYQASEILHQRPKLKSEIQSDLKTWLAKYGIELFEVSLADVGFDKGYMAAVEAKQVEEQNAQKKVYEVQQAQQEALKAAAVAKGQADATREEARGAADARRAAAQAEADSLRLRGQAQAEYNQKVSASLTPTLIEQQRIEAWRQGGAQVPTIQGGGSGTILQIPFPQKPAPAAEK